MTRRVRRWVLAVGGAGLAALLVAACPALPPFGGATHPYGDQVVRESLARQTANTIASVTSSSVPSTPSANWASCSPA